MKRILPLFLVVLLLASTMCMTAFASSAFFLEGTPYGFQLHDRPDSGFYHMRLYVSESDFLLGYTNIPVYLNFDEYCVSEIAPGNLTIFVEELGEYMPSDFILYSDYFRNVALGDCLEFYHFAYGYRSVLADGLNLEMELIPASSSSSISDIVTYDMVSGGLDQIVELLPVVLVVIVSFIGIRKGISFLLQFVHGA